MVGFIIGILLSVDFVIFGFGGDISYYGSFNFLIKEFVHTFYVNE
jgi:hypothetical protein